MPSSPFHKGIKAALADDNLQAALDKNAERRVLARKAAFASLPEPLELIRERMHTMRSHVVANLESYLETFIAKAQENGLIIHRAASAKQASEIVLAIAEQHNAKLAAKSKSMLSEEINLNAALERAGIEVVETDLGEYIVQLRGERPSHIITPAVHLRRSDVGKTFQEKLNIAYTEDIPTLIDAARMALRKTFLQAAVGISGVNFGVAATGTLCLVTNEGNGRMVTSLPPVHIALMGVERIVPTMNDLALALSMLARSATGQKISVYTQLIQAPNPEGQPRERHVVLIDNGRFALRGTGLNDALMCIRCGACLNACPVFREIGGHAYVGEHGQATTYSGPIGSVISPGLFGQGAYGHLAQACSVCGACKEACPVDIDLPTMLLRVRAEQRSGTQLPLSLRAGLGLYSWTATSARRYRAAQKLAAGFSRMLYPKQPWMRLGAWTGWGMSKDFPRPAAVPFRERFKSRQRARHEEREMRVGGDRQSISTGKVERRVDPPSEAIPRDSAEQFEYELRALEGSFIACTAETLATQILKTLREREASTITAWEDGALPVGLADAVRQGGITIVHGIQEEIRVGLTGASAAIAETGTLVLPASPGCPGETSLLPEIHLAVLYADQIYQNMAQVLALDEVVSAPSTALISGPSRTADIEMTLTLGMHGPREVVVFYVVGQM